MIKGIGMQRLISGLGFALAICSMAPAAEYQLTVDGSRNVGPHPRFWQEAVGSCHIYMTLNSAQGINFKPHFTMAAKELGMKRIRAHGLLDDDVGIYKEVNGTPSYNWKNMDSIFDFLLSIHMQPLVEMSYMPKDLASGTSTFGWYNNFPGNTTPPKDYDKWRELCFQIVKHVVDRYGTAEVNQWYWEIWNEPDLKINFTGSQEEYFRLYDYAVDGMLKADPDAKVGGPALAISGSSWIDDFIEHVMTKNYAGGAPTGPKTAFISWHNYPENNGQANTIVGSHNRVAARLAAKRAKYPAFHAKNFLTEYNMTYKGGDSYNNEIGSSFVAKMNHSMFPDQNNGILPPDLAAYWVLSDIWEEWDNTKSLAFGPMGMILRQRNARKPTYLTFQMMNMMSDTLIEFKGGTTAEPGLNGWAAIDRKKRTAQVLVYNHNRGNGDEAPEAFDKAKLTVSNLGWGNGKITVRRFGVDRNHNNCFREWEKAGKPPFPTAAVWDRMEAAGKLNEVTDGYTAVQSGGTVTLDFDQYQPGVSLFVLTGEGGVSDGLGGNQGSQGDDGSFLHGSLLRLQAESGGYALIGLPMDLVRISFLDPRGKILRTLPAQGKRMSWDGRDAFGRRVPAGMVIADIQARSGRNLQRLALP